MKTVRAPKTGGEFVGYLTPESPPWLAFRRTGITASEIAAVMGISPYGSPFDLYWRKVNGWEQPPNEEMDAGTRLEPVIAAWFAQRHPEWTVQPAGSWRNLARPWQIAHPDRLLQGPDGRVVGLLECKAVYSWDGWGVEGTGQIPVYHRAQGLWQMDTVGVDMVRFAAFGGLSFREYVIYRDDVDIAAMREAGARFVARLAAGQVPSLDEHYATLATVRRLHPDIVDERVEVSAATASGWLRANRAADLAAAALTRYRAAMRHEMGAAKHATRNGTVIASRTVDDKLKLRRG